MIKIDSENIEYKVIKNEQIIKGKKYNYTFIMRDLDSSNLITAIHCFTFEQAEKKFNEATKYV